MNQFIYITLVSAFCVLPFVALWLMATRPRTMPWWLAPAVIAVGGWIFTNGAAHFYYQHLCDLAAPYGDYPPDALIDRMNFFLTYHASVLYLGWYYSLLYSLPMLLIYAALRFLRRISLPRIAEP